MAAPSPFECLTFSRRLATATLRHGLVRRANPMIRPFSSSQAVAASDKDNGHIISSKGTQHDTSPGDAIGGSRQHATQKPANDTNVQTNAVHGGQSARADGTGGTATQGVDEGNSTAKAKRDHPEAPDVVIGMQDERGGKGY